MPIHACPPRSLPSPLSHKHAQTRTSLSLTITHTRTHTRTHTQVKDEVNHRKQALQAFLHYRSTDERDRAKWASVLEEGFTLTLPITPYRFFPRSEVRACGWGVVYVYTCVCMSVYVRATACVRYPCLVVPASLSLTYTQKRAFHVCTITIITTTIITTTIIITTNTNTTNHQQVQNSMRVVKGIEAVMADTCSLRLMVEAVRWTSVAAAVHSARYVKEKIPTQ